MSGGSGGPIIIKPRMRAVAETEAVQEQLGPVKKARLLAVLAKSDADWTHGETMLVWRCVRDALEAYED